jgi:hypothetical protein
MRLSSHMCFWRLASAKKAPLPADTPSTVAKHSELGSLRVHLTLLGNPTTGPWGKHSHRNAGILWDFFGVDIRSIGSIGPFSFHALS